MRGEAFQWFPSSLSSRAGLVSLGLFRSSLPFRKGCRQAGASLLQLGEALLTQAFPDNTGFCYSPYKPALCSGFPQTNMETFTGQPILHVCFPPSVTPCLKTTLGLKSQQPLTTSIPLSKAMSHIFIGFGASVHSPMSRETQGPLTSRTGALHTALKANLMFSTSGSNCSTPKDGNLLSTVCLFLRHLVGSE